MPRINPYSLKRPQPVQETREFTDPLQPGVSLSLTFRSKGDMSEQLAIGETSRKYTADYAEVGKDGTPPTPLPLGDTQFTPSKPLVSMIAALLVLQVPDANTTPYDFAEWCMLSLVMPTAFESAVNFATEVIQNARGELKNAPVATTEPPSVSPSTTA